MAEILLKDLKTDLRENGLKAIEAAISRCHALRREQARGRDVRRIGG